MAIRLSLLLKPLLLRHQQKIRTNKDSVESREDRMATYRAVGATSEAVIRLLQQSWQSSLFNGTDLQFAVYRTRDFAAPMDVGVSLFLYRVTVNSVQRTPPA